MKLLTITLYKLKMMFSDRLFFAAMIIIPLFITVSTGYALRYEKLNAVTIAVVDEDSSGYSQTLVDRLMKKEGFNVASTTRSKAYEMIKNNKVEAAFIIKKGFEEKIISGESKEVIDAVKSPASTSAGFIGEVIAGEVMRFRAENIAADWVAKQYRKLNKPVSDELLQEVIRYTDEQWEPRPLMTVDYREMEGDTPKEVERVSMPAATATSAGIIVVFIMLFVLFSSGWLIEERRNGTLKRLVSGPSALGFSFLGSILALMISGMLQILLFTLVDKLAFSVDLFPGGWSYLVFFAYLTAVISISMFLSSILKTPAQLQAGAPVFALLTGFAGGCFWNFIEMPGQIRSISMLTPQGWALEGINRLLVDPSNVLSITTPVLVLFSLSFVLLPVSYCVIKKSVRS